MNDPADHTESNLDAALDALGDEGGVVEVQRGTHRAEVDVIEADRLGVRVRGVTVHAPHDRDIAREAARLPERLRALPDRVEPVEVAPELGGAILRTPADRVQRGRFYQVDVRPRHTTIGRREIGADGGRVPVDFTLTREQLERLIEQTEGDAG